MVEIKSGYLSLYFLLSSLIRIYDIIVWNVHRMNSWGKIYL